ncbi:MAG TPA: DUF2442 domain-containing protein [Rhizomicrobium sp.]|nr:DUF2442 domain-containing protein [Rhizomicrobium sp.]
MSISAAKRDTRVADVEVNDTTLLVSLRDGRKISAPLSWFPRLAQASQEDRSVWEPSAAGHGIHWPKIDEDLSIEGLLRGQPAH